MVHISLAPSKDLFLYNPPCRTRVDAALAEENLEMTAQWIQAISQSLLASLSQEEVFPVRRLFLKDRKESVLSPAWLVLG